MLSAQYADIFRRRYAEATEILRDGGYLVVAPGETVIATPGLYLMKEDTGRVFVDKRSDPFTVKVLADALNDYLKENPA